MNKYLVLEVLAVVAIIFVCGIFWAMKKLGVHDGPMIARIAIGAFLVLFIAGGLISRKYLR